MSFLTIRVEVSRLVRARPVDLRHGGTHRSQVGGDLSAMMDDVEQEAPRHLGRWPLMSEELERAVPLLGGKRVPSPRKVRTLTLVLGEDLLHRRGHRPRSPL